MKTKYTSISKLFCVLLSIVFFTNNTKAQCDAPAMIWHNPVLISGTALQKGAVYQFPFVTAGVHANVTVVNFVGGAKLSEIDNTSFGYDAAFQPVVKTPENQGASSSFVSFKIEFVNSVDGSKHTFNCFQLSFIDVDGDNYNVKEFVAAKLPDSVIVSNTTVLQISNLTGNMVQAQGPFKNYVDIDTSAYNTNVNFWYKNTDKVLEIRVGNVTNASFTVQDRYSCGYFKPIVMPIVAILPVKYLSFNANAYSSDVMLSWVTSDEINNNHFEVERSIDGISFIAIGKVLEGFVSGTRKSYLFKDLNVGVEVNGVVYYRLKQIDIDGKGTCTKTLAVKLNTTTVDIQTFPNPFVESVNVRFNSNQSNTASIYILIINGQKIITQQAAVNKGNNTMQLNSVASLKRGTYILQLELDGKILASQKIIKN